MNKCMHYINIAESSDQMVAATQIACRLEAGWYGYTCPTHPPGEGCLWPDKCCAEGIFKMYCGNHAPIGSLSVGKWKRIVLPSHMTDDISAEQISNLMLYARRNNPQQKRG